MRAHGLLSPHRGRQGAAKTHDGRVITQAPNVMWGTDGVRGFTLDDGWGWIFAAVEHWNAECVGWHVCKVGSRFAALDPIAQGLERLYGSLDADVARGLALRMDHGSQYLSDHFLKQIRYWGIHPSFGFVEEPETNGVVERWNRTLKEQAIHGRIFQNLEAIRAAVADFVELGRAGVSGERTIHGRGGGRAALGDPGGGAPGPWPRRGVDVRRPRGVVPRRLRGASPAHIEYGARPRREPPGDVR